jgi:hypothetical protein
VYRAKYEEVSIQTIRKAEINTRPVGPPENPEVSMDSVDVSRDALMVPLATRRVNEIFWATLLVVEESLTQRQTYWAHSANDLLM